MCGLAGCFGNRDETTINKMLDVMPHRGPNDRGKYAFTTDSDPEAILHLYRARGPRSVCELDGMFAFAIFDGDNYMLARDPIGIKPL